MKRAILEQLRQDRRAKRPVVLVTALATGEQSLIHPLEDNPGAAPELLEAARVASSRDRSTVVEAAGAEVFLHVFNPPLRLVVVGAVHIAQSLCPMAALAGFEVIVVDPRTAFASAERFPGMALSHAWPDEALDALDLDGRTAVVTLTHDPKLDEPALIRALHSPVFYIGALGSKKTQASRLARLAGRGFDERALSRIHGPVGLSIGARGAAEIAVSILAQVIAALRGQATAGAAGQPGPGERAS